MRQEGTLQSKPRALPNEDEPLMSVLWENTEPKNIDNAVAVVETVTPGTKTLGSQVSAPIVTAEETSAYKTVSKVIVQGLVLQGHVYEFPPCKNCMIEDELIVL